MSTYRPYFLIITLVCALLIVSTAAAAPGATFNSVVEENCVITAVITVRDAGTYYFEVFDDGQRAATIPFTAALNETVTIHYRFERSSAEGAPGVALAITNGQPAATIRYYALIDSFSLSEECLRTFGCQILIPVDAVVGSLPESTQAFYEPGNISPDVFINPGTYWVFDTDTDDAGNAYYRILLACQFLYVPVDAMEPNFDEVWQGRALPSVESNLLAEGG